MKALRGVAPHIPNLGGDKYIISLYGRRVNVQD
jgi:hypothetical protein